MGTDDYFRWFIVRRIGGYRMYMLIKLICKHLWVPAIKIHPSGKYVTLAIEPHFCVRDIS